MQKRERPSYEVWDEKFAQRSKPPYCIYDVDTEKGIARITFNKPEKLNAATPGDVREIREKTIEAEEDAKVKVVIYKGAGQCFSSGIDLEWLSHAFNIKGERRLSQRYRYLRSGPFLDRRGLYQTVLYCLKATIAQVHGYCYGSGFQIACACDIVVASEDAIFTNPAYKYIGASPEDMVLLFLTMGVKKTKEMMLTGRALDAQEALKCGLINKVVPRDKLEEEVNKIAETIARQPYDAIVMGKANFEAALDIAGVGACETAGHAQEAWQSNIQYRPGEFNLIKSLAEKGVKGAIREREDFYSGAPLRRK
jgi:enoyl-CoA hydratase